MLGLLRQKLCKGLGPHSCLGMRSKGSSGFQFSRDESYLSSYPDGPQRKDVRGKGNLCFPSAGALYLGFQAAGGRRRGWLLCARRLPGQSVSAVLAGSTWRNHRGRGNCVGLLGEPQARSTSCLLAQCRRVPGMSIAPGGGVCPGPRLARSCPPPGPPPRPAQRPWPPRWRSRASSRDCRPPQRAGGPGLAPRRTGGGGLGRGCVVVRGTLGGRGPRPLRQCGRSALSARAGSGDVLREKTLSKPQGTEREYKQVLWATFSGPFIPGPEREERCGGT